MSMKKHLELIESISSRKQVNEDVDLKSARKDLKEKIKELKDAMSNFTKLSDDETTMLDAMPSGTKDVMVVQRGFSSIEEKLDSLSNSLMNEQNWDSDKLKK